jgi:hypothetical protein
MKIHIEVPWVATTCSLAEGYQHCGGTHCLYVPITYLKMEAKCSLKIWVVYFLKMESLRMQIIYFPKVIDNVFSEGSVVPEYTEM